MEISVKGYAWVRAVNILLMAILLARCGNVSQRQYEAATLPRNTFCIGLQASAEEREKYGIPAPAGESTDDIARSCPPNRAGTELTPASEGMHRGAYEQSSSVDEVNLERRGDTFRVPVRINGVITLPFILDSGASVLTIPADVALTLMRAGALLREDFIGKGRYQLANGTEEISHQVIIREVQVGRFVVKGVTAIVTAPEGEPLLGQSFLSGFASWSLDNERKMLVLRDKTSTAAISPVSSIAVPGLPAYGAIAWDKESGKRGWSWNQPTSQRAWDVALSECGASGCKVVIRTGAGVCAALATTVDGKFAGGAARRTEDDARLAAVANCQQGKAGDCIVRVSDCNR
jgi:serine/threonine-protein kinase